MKDIKDEYIGIKLDEVVLYLYKFIDGKIKRVNTMSKMFNDNGDIIVEIHPEGHRLYFNIDNVCYKAEQL